MLGKTIADARKKRGLSQKELVVKIKKEDGEAISPQYFNDIERDRRVPTQYIIEQLAKELNLDRDYLCLLAERVPQDIKNTILNSDPKKVIDAYKAFRKTIKKNK